MLISSLSPYVQQQLLQELTIDEIVAALDHMDLLTAQKVLRRIKDARRRHKIILKLKSDVREKIEYFIRFHPKATLALVHFNYVLLPQTTTISEAGDAIDAHYKETGKFPEVLVHKNGVLIGEVSIATLVQKSNASSLDQYVTPVLTISFHAEVQTVVEIVQASKRNKVVIVDTDESVLGIIYTEDALELFEQLPAESLYNFVGVDIGERPFDTVRDKFLRRYRWLVLNLLTAFLVGFVVFLFKDTIDRIAILAVYIPIVAGMGGNAASQTFAVVVRGITMGSITLKNGLPAIRKEMQAGFLNGLLIGVLVAVISVVFNESFVLGLVVGIAMIIVHTVAGLSGAFVPLLLKHFGKDPASISMIFISTVTDVCGILTLLGLGALLLK